MDCKETEPKNFRLPDEKWVRPEFDISLAKEASLRDELGRPAPLISAFCQALFEAGNSGEICAMFFSEGIRLDCEDQLVYINAWLEHPLGISENDVFLEENFKEYIPDQGWLPSGHREAVDNKLPELKVNVSWGLLKEANPMSRKKRRPIGK